jgi:NAD(P)-dependent dehydrogenase (short-subunit alcohol dehydrogenase family)
VTELLAGQVAFVTGGARGIGLAVAQRLARAGAAVMIGDLDGDSCETAAELLREGGARAEAVRVDVADEASLHAAADSCLERLGRVDVVVANAGIAHLSLLVDTDPAAFRRVVEVNLMGTFLTLREFGRRLIDQGRGGRIIASSSLFGVRGGRENAAYSASKFGVIGLVQCAAAELAPHGVLVNAVCPGQVDTEMIDRLCEDRAALTGRTAVQVRETMTQRVPLGRFAAIEEVADTYLYLASPLAGYVTGQSLVVDGGMQVA